MMGLGGVRRDDPTDDSPVKPPRTTSTVGPSGKSSPSPTPFLTKGNVTGKPEDNTSSDQAVLEDKFGTGFINYDANKAQQARDKSNEVQGLPGTESLNISSQNQADEQAVRKRLQDAVDSMFSSLSDWAKGSGKFGAVANNSGYLGSMGSRVGSALGLRGY